MAERTPHPDTLIFLKLEHLEQGMRVLKTEAQGLREDMQAMLGFHKKMLALLEAQQSPKVEIADWDTLYAEDDPGKEVTEESVDIAPRAEELARQPGGWRKVFQKREKA